MNIVEIYNKNQNDAFSVSFKMFEGRAPFHDLIKIHGRLSHLGFLDHIIAIRVVNDFENMNLIRVCTTQAHNVLSFIEAINIVCNHRWIKVLLIFKEKDVRAMFFLENKRVSCIHISRVN